MLPVSRSVCLPLALRLSTMPVYPLHTLYTYAYIIRYMYLLYAFGRVCLCGYTPMCECVCVVYGRSRTCVFVCVVLHKNIHVLYIHAIQQMAVIFKEHHLYD